MTRMILPVVAVLVITFLSCCTHSKKTVAGARLTKKGFTDSIKFVDRYGYILLKSNFAGKEGLLLFDTGADMLVLPADSSQKGHRVNISDGTSEHPVAGSLIELNELHVANLNYRDISALGVPFPPPLACIADGILGNNLISKSNWKIKNNVLIVSDKNFGCSENKFRIHFANSFRMFSGITIGKLKLDSCLIDYGGRFEITLPASDYSLFMKNLNNINYESKQRPSQWTINGRRSSDTIIIVNCDLEFCGIPLKKVNVEFSPTNHERQIGLQLLRRIETVVINSKRKEICFAGSDSTFKPEPELLLNIELVNGEFVVENRGFGPEAGYQFSAEDKIVSINGRRSEFANYCDFISWKQQLRTTWNFIIVMNDGRKVKIKNPLKVQ